MILEEINMYTILIISILIVIIVLLLSILTISKGYSYKHTIDPIPEELTKNVENLTELSSEENGK